jgi:inosine/xanthosine triphosphate pyrophosphatase family protein
VTLATRATRRNQRRAEVRMDEIMAVASIGTTYESVDRAGDLEIEGHFRRLYELVDSEDEREAVARAFAVHMAAERREDFAVRGSVDEASATMKANNGFWLDGAFVPGDSDGAA